MELLMFVKEKKLVTVYGAKYAQEPTPHVDVQLCSRDLDDMVSVAQRHNEPYNHCWLQVSLLEGEDNFKLGQTYKITIQPFTEERR